MTYDEIVESFTNLTVWERGGIRAPHKPLLALYAIGQLLCKKPRMIKYTDIDGELNALLVAYGPHRKTHHQEYPFHRLRGDGIWELDNENLAPYNGSKDYSRAYFIEHEISGGFNSEIYDALCGNQRLVSRIVLQLLSQNFPTTLHEDILIAVGIGLSLKDQTLKTRDPDFRKKILKAYQYECAVCGFDVRVGDNLVALEASHIKWHQASGPDIEANGLALCTMHHKLFDRGAFTISGGLSVVVSEIAHGKSGFSEWLMSFHGHSIQLPIRSCVFRTMPTTDSGACRPPIPGHADHPFRLMPTTHSGPCRPPLGRWVWFQDPACKSA